MATFQDVLTLQYAAHGLNQNCEYDPAIKKSPLVFSLMSGYMKRIREMHMKELGLKTAFETYEHLLSSPAGEKAWLNSPLSPEIEAVYQEWVQKLKENDRLTTST